jgi:hypothetical protein
MAVFGCRQALEIVLESEKIRMNAKHGHRLLVHLVDAMRLVANRAELPKRDNISGNHQQYDQDEAQPEANTDLQPAGITSLPQ